MCYAFVLHNICADTRITRAEASQSHLPDTYLWGQDLCLIVLFWQVIMMIQRVALQRAVTSARLYIWPYGCTAVIFTLVVYDMSRLGTLYPDRQIYAASLFAAASAVNLVAEALAIAWR